MLRKRKRLLAQSTLEYVVLIALVVFALLATQTFIKRAIQGRLRSSADEIGEQFAPGASRMQTNITSRSRTLETVIGNITNSVVQAGDTQTRNVTVEIGNFETEYWPSCGNDRCEPGEETSCPDDCD